MFFRVGDWQKSLWRSQVFWRAAKKNFLVLGYNSVVLAGSYESKERKVICYLLCKFFFLKFSMFQYILYDISDFCSYSYFYMEQGYFFLLSMLFWVSDLDVQVFYLNIWLIKWNIPTFTKSYIYIYVILKDQWLWNMKSKKEEKKGGLRPHIFYICYIAVRKTTFYI